MQRGSTVLTPTKKEVGVSNSRNTSQDVVKGANLTAHCVQNPTDVSTFVHDDFTKQNLRILEEPVQVVCYAVPSFCFVHGITSIEACTPPPNKCVDT